ncbi:unnamed protein product [Urochloa decumbens]|uniref:non-specific serine/threonine protein kinase n=1 Tax=Urochloa decumbens TaxID=240449 RepID=A0ABC9B1F9_9POAL
MASAASRSTQLILLISTCSFLLPLSLDAQETNNKTVASPPPQTTFSFNFSNPSSYDLKRDLRLQGRVSQNGSLIDLSIDNGLGSSTAGRMSYKYPVRFYDDTTMASFSTHFTFEIVPVECSSPFILSGCVAEPGDGMAFFLSGYPSAMGVGGGYLGLYSDDNAPFIAVEFDTYQNEWDPDNRHIGIDINFVTSSNTTTLPNNLTLKGTMAATITFDSITRMLVASLLFHDHPSIEPVVVSHKLRDPKSLLPRDVAVGFSGSTGIHVEHHHILTWSFNSTFAAPTPPKGHRSIILVIAMVAPILALFICGIVSFKYIKRHRKDEIQRALLDWNKRLAIIEGISQGILYLHKHSRLRVIHRDLKASNILLDHDMNPKISDFGLAKIFSLTDTEGNTKRIVGTYGYMAPEYASEGLFSIKSDVFSLGVLILEIISGKRTSSFHQYGDFINLLGHVSFFNI